MSTVYTGPMTIDSHVHIASDHPDILALAKKHDLFWISICVAEEGDEWRSQADAYSRLARLHPNRFAWCTSFSLPEPAEFASAAARTSYADRVLARLEQDLTDGASACKIWKNVGMDIKDDSGRFVMPDHPIFDPVYGYLAQESHTLVAHLGEPLVCWKPIAEGTPHSGYYAENPQWHMYGKAGFPSHAQIITARDNVLARHPDLQVIGAHLGSLEHDVREVADRLDKYPNFHVDFSARLVNFVHQDQEVVREFFLRYSKRVLFGTDVSFENESDAQAEAATDVSTSAADEQYSRAFAYLQSDSPVTMLGRTVSGLALPEDVTGAVLRENALNLFRGVQGH